MATYYVAETDAKAKDNNDDLWQELTAKTLTSAKRAASRSQMFQGTSLHIAVRTCNGDYIRIAVKRADALNMNHRPVWQDISEEQ